MASTSGNRLSHAVSVKCGVSVADEIRLIGGSCGSIPQTSSRRRCVVGVAAADVADLAEALGLGQGVGQVSGRAGVEDRVEGAVGVEIDVRAFEASEDDGVLGVVCGR